MKNKFSRADALALTIVGIVAFSLAACGGKVQGNTYTGNGGVVVVEFKSGGKAYIATGPVSTPCTYTESGNRVTLVCEGKPLEFTVDDEGSLIGPPDGFVARLTKKK